MIESEEQKTLKEKPLRNFICFGKIKFLKLLGDI